jgi:ribonuclease VapC
VILDTSALLAILRDEPDALAFALAIEHAPVRRISAGTYLEASIMIGADRNPIANRKLDEFIREANLVVEPVTFEQAQIGRAAYQDFGKGSGHPAQLNFGDCFAYALARATGEPLLFKGEDFRWTDLPAAL